MFNRHPFLSLSQPRLMAIVNATPDSFSDGGELYRGTALDKNKVIARLQSIIAEGADIIDVGGESTRPGAAPVSEQEELDRVIPIVEWVAQESDVAISVDTSSPQVMLQAAASGAHMINDVRALSREGALSAAAATGMAVCLMHMQGNPLTMQQAPQYNAVVDDVIAYLQSRIQACLAAGVAKENISIDPGFGFGKTLEHNLQLLHGLSMVSGQGFPVLVGLSRKSMIDHLLQRDIQDRLPASLALGLMSLERGASILRVHDVRATRDIIDTYIAVSRSGEK